MCQRGFEGFLVETETCGVTTRYQAGGISRAQALADAFAERVASVDEDGTSAPSASASCIKPLSRGPGPKAY